MDVRLAAVLAAVMLFGPVAASAAVNALSAIGPAGGVVNKILFSATPNVAFLINYGGFYRSQDGGVSWTLVSQNTPSPFVDMALDPSNPKRLYAVNNAPDSVFVSTDGGVSLSVVSSLPSAVTQPAKVVISQNGATICLANAAQLYCSVDSGQSWQARTPVSTYANALINNLIMDPEDSNSMYVTAVVSATGTANLATHDGGLTWTPLAPTDVSNPGVYALAINPTNSLQLWSAQTNGVWMSADRGQTWTNLLATYVVSIAIDATNPAIVYVGDGQGHLLRSSNSGSAWTDVTGNLAVNNVGSIAINTSQDSQLLVGGLNGVAGSSTAGVTWAVQNTGFNGTTVTELSADPSTDRIYIAVPESGIFYTANGSGTTAAVNNAALAQFQYQSSNLSAGPVLAQPGGVMVGLSQNVARSNDGGNTWSFATVTQNDALTALVGAAAAPNVVLAASPTGLYRSNDGGSSWNPITSGLPVGVGVGNGSGPSVGSLYAAQSNPNVFYYASPVQPAAAGGFLTPLTLYQSMDAGVTWSARNYNAATGPDAILCVDPTNANVLYAAADANGTAAGIQLLKSADGGMTWTALGWNTSVWSQLPLTLAVDPVHPQILYASTIGPLGRSVDGGASWQVFLSPDRLWWNSWSLVVDPKRPETLLVSTAMSGVQEITFEPDLALTAAAPTNPIRAGVASNYTYTVSNKGPFDATGVTVKLQLPSTAEQISATANGGTCSVAATAASCTFAVLRTGASAAVTLTATAPSVGSFLVAGSVSGDQPDPDTTNNAITSTANVVKLADVGVTVTGIASAQLGDPVNYTLSVSNAGPDTATGAQVTFQLAAGLTFGTASASLGTCSEASNLVSCNLGDLAPATPVTVTVNAATAAVGTQVSGAAVTTSATDTVAANNKASATTTVTAVPPASGKGGGGSLSLLIILALAVCRTAELARRRL
jgi:uncharacterized repeat protein (TIGR01451 family)